MAKLQKKKALIIIRNENKSVVRPLKPMEVTKNVKNNNKM